MKGARIFFLIMILSFCSSLLQAQKIYVKVSGYVKDEQGKPLSGVGFSTHWSEGKVGDDEFTKGNGAFMVWLSIENDWRVIFKKEGYQETHFKVDARVYGDPGKSDGAGDFEVSYILPFPVTMLKGSGKNPQAVTKVFYNQSQKKLTNTPLVKPENKVDPNDAKYKRLIAEGDKLRGDEEYVAAKATFEQALRLKPNERYPKTQIAELEKLIILEGEDTPTSPTVAATPEKDEYAAHIKKGDACFRGKDYEGAIENYKKALTVKPNDTYSKNQIAKVEQILAEPQLSSEEIEQKYKELIGRADRAFDREDYLNVKVDYKAANKLKPNDGYSKGKVEQINVILTEIEKTLQEIEGLTQTPRVRSKEGAEDLINKMELLNYKLVQYEKASSEKFQKAFNEKRAKNLSTKYETGNPLTSLYDVVEEHDKENNR